MKSHLLSIPLALALLGSSLAHADECSKYKTSYDQTYCMAKLFLESDKELNSVYGDLRNASPDRARQSLKEVQLDWIKHRNSTCEQHGTIDVDCNFRVNRERAEYLRDRLRECKAGTCREEMITAKSWN